LHQLNIVRSGLVVGLSVLRATCQIAQFAKYAAIFEIVYARFANF